MLATPLQYSVLGSQGHVALGAIQVAQSLRRPPITTVCLVMLILTSFSSVTQATGVIVDSNGFENPDYAPGSIVNQQGWLWASLGDAGTATVQAGIVQSGNQAVEVFRGANSYDRWAVPVSGFPDERFMVIDWDMRVEDSGGGSNAYGPFFGVEAYDYDTSDGYGLLASLGVDATSSDILYQIQDTGALTETGWGVNFGEWFHFQIRLDFATEQYAAFAGGAWMATTGFVDRSAGLDDFTDADISALAAAADPTSQALTGTAYFDNFIVREGPRADFDFDGDVDGEDLLDWQAGFAIDDTGDADGDADTDGNDFLIWQRQYVSTTGATATANVPEPAAALIGLLLLGIGRLLLPQGQRNRS